MEKEPAASSCRARCVTCGQQRRKTTHTYTNTRTDSFWTPLRVSRGDYVPIYRIHARAHQHTRITTTHTQSHILLHRQHAFRRCRLRLLSSRPSFSHSANPPFPLGSCPVYYLAETTSLLYRPTFPLFSPCWSQVSRFSLPEPSHCGTRFFTALTVCIHKKTRPPPGSREQHYCQSALRNDALPSQEEAG